jgi:hypothetical protein
MFKRRMFRRAALIAVLAIAGLTGLHATVGPGTTGCRFIQYYQQSSEASLTFWERVVFSLIMANSVPAPPANTTSS